MLLLEHHTYGTASSPMILEKLGERIANALARNTTLTALDLLGMVWRSRGAILEHVKDEQNTHETEFWYNRLREVKTSECFTNQFIVNETESPGQ